MSQEIKPFPRRNTRPKLSAASPLDHVKLTKSSTCQNNTHTLSLNLLAVGRKYLGDIKPMSRIPSLMLENLQNNGQCCPLYMLPSPTNTAFPHFMFLPIKMPTRAPTPRATATGRSIDFSSVGFTEFPLNDDVRMGRPAPTR